MELFINDKSEEDNLKYTFFIQLPKKDWDGIKSYMKYAAKGFDPKTVQKKQAGEDVLLTFDLGPGQ